MADTADVIVVGGGVNGASIAWALASRGVGRVVLCEKGALASGASGRSSALVRMHYTNETDARLAFASFPIFRHWTEDRKSTRLNSSHDQISYAVFCLKKKNTITPLAIKLQ